MRFVRLRVPDKILVTRHRRLPVNRLLPVFIATVIVSTVLLVTLPHVLLLSNVEMRKNLTFATPIARQTAAVRARNCSGIRRWCNPRIAPLKARPTPRMTTVFNTTTTTPKPNRRILKLEQLIDRNVVSVQLNAARFWREINERRIKAIITQVARPISNSTANYTYICDADYEDHLPVRPLCPSVPPNLVGPLPVTLDHSHDEHGVEAWLNKSQPELCPGGRWRPRQCNARHRVAIVIPYRDRKEHLAILLAHLHPILQRQQLDYRVYVVEQYDNGTFNKGVLMNAAFLLSSRSGAAFQCYVFHDTDLLPEDDRNMYSCPPQPRHMSVSIDKFKYILPYSYLVGGVFSIRTDHFLLLNGYSNLYWGWGGEDDDMYGRMVRVGLSLVRPPSNIARYTMMKHVQRNPLTWNIRSRLLQTAKQRMNFDGLNSVKYKLISEEEFRLYTHYVVDVGHNPFTNI